VLQPKDYLDFPPKRFLLYEQGLSRNPLYSLLRKLCTSSATFGCVINLKG
jgi:hypothetical protein